MSWLILVYQQALRTVSDEDKAVMATQCHTAIISDNSLQDADTVLAILRESLILYKKGHPQITEIWIRSDNAGKPGAIHKL